MYIYIYILLTAQEPAIQVAGLSRQLGSCHEDGRLGETRLRTEHVQAEDVIPRLLDANLELDLRCWI